MRTLAVGLFTGNPLGRGLVLAVAVSACVGTAGAADDAILISQSIFDPSITVSEAPQRVAPRAALATGLVITPIFDPSITNDPNGATIMNTINTAIAFYEANISDQVTVLIKFKKMSAGLGLSQTSIPCAPCGTPCGCGSISYTSYLAQLTAHATSADDATAVSLLPPGPNNPVNGNANMWVKNANLRALGFTVSPPPGSPDSTISLHTAICNLDRSSIDPMKYDLLAVVSHEIDEALGLGSALAGPNGAPAPAGPVYPEDLFRYDQVGARSFNTALASQAFFSIDGTTQLARFNQTAGGDFGDWFSPFNVPHTPQVQDAFATPGATPDPGVELTVLDVIGYTLGSSTPPTQDDDTGFVPPDANTLTCEAGVAKNLKNLGSCIETCHIKASAAAFTGAFFDEEACETSDPKKSCRAKYNAKQANLLAAGTCPACLDATHQATLADQAQSDLDDGNGALYCAGTVALGGDDPGFVPPDANTLTCEAGVAKNLSNLEICIKGCHLKAATLAFNGKPFDEEGCEMTDPKKSCRAKYDAKQANLLAAGTCPPCLDAAHQAMLADQAESDLDAANGSLFCAGTTPLPPPW